MNLPLSLHPHWTTLAAVPQARGEHPSGEQQPPAATGVTNADASARARYARASPHHHLLPDAFDSDAWWWEGRQAL